MSDTPPEGKGKTDSKSNLIEVHHIGVTAKLQTPLRNLMNSYCSSTETDGNQTLHRGDQRHSNSKYAKLNNAIETDTTTTTAAATTTTTTDNTKVLYEMRTSRGKENDIKKAQNRTPSKIEFQLYTKKHHGKQHGHTCAKLHTKFKSNKNMKKRKVHRRLFINNGKSKHISEKMSIFKRLRQTLQQLRTNSKLERPTVDKIFDEFPEPVTIKSSSTQQPLRDVRIGIYPFDHGCTEYLKTHDAPPQIISIYLAERAIYYATRFWGEFFGSIHIGVAFIITFMLQTYRFFLYCLINTLLVGFLHMTSDYFIKPLLTVLFNGFLQPILTFCLNILSSIRDTLVPVADLIDHFMRPVATVGKSFRLIHATYNKPNNVKSV